VRVAAAETPSAGSAVGFAIRPEKMRVGRTPPANASVNAARGELWDIAYLGDMTVFHVKLQSGKVVKASSLNAQRSVDDPFIYDQEVWVSFDENAGVLLKD
jgi:putrescine transport system ATP-binding protein